MLYTSNKDGFIPGRDRRKDRRVNPGPDDITTIYYLEDRWPGIIIDESDNGFAVAVPISIPVQMGDMVRIAAHRNLLKAKVVGREIRKGGIRLGLELEK